MRFLNFATGSYFIWWDMAQGRSDNQNYGLRRLSHDEMDQAAVIHRKAFDERLPWLSGHHTPDEDRTFFRESVFGNCEVWGAFVDDGLIGFPAFQPISRPARAGGNPGLPDPLHDDRHIVGGLQCCRLCPALLLRHHARPHRDGRSHPLRAQAATTASYPECRGGG